MSSTYGALAGLISQFENNQIGVNNPGALQDSSGSMLNFSSYDEGYQALLDKLGFDASGQSSTYNPNMSLQDFVNTYTGTQTGEPNNYAQGLANELGVSTSTPLSQLSDQNLYQAQAANNGTNPYDISGLSAPTYSPEAQSTEAATGSVPTNTQGAGPAQGSTSSGLFTQFEQWITSETANYAGIIIGIVLIGGAIFTFKSVSDTVVNVARKGAQAATLAG